MTRVLRRMPDFAGVALVDILANGVAMLIIVIVVSIAARMEREERYAEQASEIATVMSHKFSTSLVLNSLAASPPARLHDYETSPMDQILLPELLPILELHTTFVREFYSGTIWTRRDLLEEHGTFGAWLAGMNAGQASRMRIDVYDIPQFYLTMSILREHGIFVYHWHFLTGTLALRDAGRCPPRVAAKDCLGTGEESAAPLPQLALDDVDSRGLEDLDWSLNDVLPGPGQGRGGDASSNDVLQDGRGSGPGPMPGGVVPGAAGSAGSGLAAGGGVGETGGGGLGAGGGSPGDRRMERGLLYAPQGTGSGGGFGSEPRPNSGSAADLGSFPNARRGGAEPSPGLGRGRPTRGGEGRNGQGQSSSAGSGSGNTGLEISLRIALPQSIRRAAQSGGQAAPALEALFGIILHYLGEMQDSLDTGGTPSRQIDGFAERIQTAFREPPQNTEAQRNIARDLALKFALLPHLGEPGSRPDPLTLRPASSGPDPDAVLQVVPNSLNDVIGVDRGGMGPDATERDDRERAGTREDDEARDDEHPGADDDAGASADGTRPGRGRTAFSLNAYPGIWKGLEIRLEPYSVLLMPPDVRQGERMRWRAVAYVTPALDDVIVGFVFARVDAEGRLRIQADANRVALDGRPLFSTYSESGFGSRGWLVSLYGALAAGLLLLGIGWRFLAGRTE